MSRNPSELFSPVSSDTLYKVGDRVIQREIAEFDRSGKLCEEDMLYAIRSLEQAATWFGEEGRADEADHAQRLIGIAQRYLANYKNDAATFHTPKPPKS